MGDEMTDTIKSDNSDVIARLEKRVLHYENVLADVERGARDDFRSLLSDMKREQARADMAEADLIHLKATVDELIFEPKWSDQVTHAFVDGWNQAVNRLKGDLDRMVADRIRGEAEESSTGTR